MQWKAWSRRGQTLNDNYKWLCHLNWKSACGKVRLFVGFVVKQWLYVEEPKRMEKSPGEFWSLKRLLLIRYWTRCRNVLHKKNNLKKAKLSEISELFIFGQKNSLGSQQNVSQKVE